MNTARTQHNRILAILKEKGDFGMNSFEYRTSFIQLPVRIKELKKLGYTIISQHNKNRSVNYILVDSYASPKINASKTILEPLTTHHYHFEGTSGYKVMGSEESCFECNPKPTQEQIWKGVSA